MHPERDLWAEGDKPPETHRARRRRWVAAADRCLKSASFVYGEGTVSGIKVEERIVRELEAAFQEGRAADPASRAAPGDASARPASSRTASDAKPRPPSGDAKSGGRRP